MPRYTSMVCSFTPFKCIHWFITIQCWSSVICLKGFSLHSMSNPAGNYWPFSVSLCDMLQIRSDQSLSCVRLFATPWIAARLASLSITNSRSSWRLTSIESVMPSSHLILSRPLLLLPPIPPSIKVFSSESTLHMRWPKYWSFSFSIIPSKVIPGLISFGMDWLNLLAVQGTLKTLLQHQLKSINSSALSLLHSPTLTSIHDHRKKNIDLTRWHFVGKIMSLLLNVLSKLVISFLPRGKRLLISWQKSSPSVVILEPRKIKSYTVYTVSPSISHEVMGLDVMISIFWMLSFKPQGLLYSPRTNGLQDYWKRKKERKKEKITP